MTVLSRCDYFQARFLVRHEIAKVVGCVWMDVSFIYGLQPGPSGAFAHYWGELRKLLGWYGDELLEHAREWSGRPLPLPSTDVRERMNLHQRQVAGCDASTPCCTVSDAVRRELGL